MHYDTEANLISWEISRGHISHAKEFGNFIIHFSASGRPLLVEVLNASSIAKQFGFNKKNIAEIKPAEIASFLGFTKLDN